MQVQKVLIELLPLRLDPGNGHPVQGLGRYGFSTGFRQGASEDRGSTNNADLLVACFLDRNRCRFFCHGVSFPVYLLRHSSTADDSSAECLYRRLILNRGPWKLAIDRQNATKIFVSLGCPNSRTLGSGSPTDRFPGSGPRGHGADRAPKNRWWERCLALLRRRACAHSAPPWRCQWFSLSESNERDSRP